MDLILAIDIGTTNCKAVTFDTDGNVIHSIKDGYATETDEHGKCEQKPDEIFDVVIKLVQQSVTANKEITAVGFSAAMHSLIAVDKEGKPITNAIIWADTRSISQAEKLKESSAGKTIYNKTGTPIHPMSPLCKIIWLRETQPEIFSKTYKFISIKEYIFLKLFGTYLIDYSIASATGLFNTKQTNWCAEALQVAGIQTEQLSQPVEVTHSETNLLPTYKNLFGSKQSVKFIVGGNDGCLANLGSGVISPGDASLTIGTSGAIRLTTDTIKPDAEQRLFTYLLTKDIYITGGAINNGGITMEWLSKIVMNGKSAKEPDELLQLAETSPAGANALLFLPYLLGERAPMWDANAKGVLFGLTQQHTKAHISRAGVEGICFALRSVMQAIEEVNEPIKRIYASGGFTQSHFWLQTMADILGKKIIIHNNADASATGAAIIAMYALGHIKNLSEAARFSEALQSYSPNTKTRNLYDSLFAIFQRLYPKLKDEFAQISKL